MQFTNSNRPLDFPLGMCALCVHFHDPFDRPIEFMFGVIFILRFVCLCVVFHYILLIVVSVFQ